MRDDNLRIYFEDLSDAGKSKYIEFMDVDAPRDRKLGLNGKPIAIIKKGKKEYKDPKFPTELDVFPPEWKKANDEGLLKLKRRHDGDGME